MSSMYEVKHPSHYQSSSGLECKDVIAAITENLSGQAAFNLGNAVKYLWRFTKKGTPVQDLNKAKEYIDFILADLENTLIYDDKVTEMLQRHLADTDTDTDAMSGTDHCSECANHGTEECHCHDQDEFKGTPEITKRVITFTKENYKNLRAEKILTPEQTLMLDAAFCSARGNVLFFDKENILNQYRSGLILFPKFIMEQICRTLRITNEELSKAKGE